MSCGILSLYCKTIADEMGRAETTNARVCGKCGNTIFDTAPQGLCSVCLFDTGLSILTESVGGPNAKDFRADNDSAPQTPQNCSVRPTIMSYWRRLAAVDRVLCIVPDRRV